jgi:hypothetical protein
VSSKESRDVLSSGRWMEPDAASLVFWLSWFLMPEHGRRVLHPNRSGRPKVNIDKPDGVRRRHTIAMKDLGRRTPSRTLAHAPCDVDYCHTVLGGGLAGKL